MRWPSTRVLVVASVALLGLTAVLGLLLHDAVGPTRLDAKIASWVVPRAPDGSFADRSELRRVVAFASPEVLIVAIAGAAAVALQHRDRHGALVVVAGPAAAAALGEWVMKPLVDRTAATTGAYSFPSVTVAAFAATCVAVALMVHRIRPRWTVAAIAAAGAATAVIGTAVVALSWHYATDAVAGCAFGCGCVTLLAAIDAMTTERARRIPL